MATRLDLDIHRTSCLLQSSFRIHLIMPASRRLILNFFYCHPKRKACSSLAASERERERDEKRGERKSFSLPSSPPGASDHLGGGRASDLLQPLFSPLLPISWLRPSERGGGGGLSCLEQRGEREVAVVVGRKTRQVDSGGCSGLGSLPLFPPPPAGAAITGP